MTYIMYNKKKNEAKIKYIIKRYQNINKLYNDINLQYGTRRDTGTERLMNAL